MIRFINHKKIKKEKLLNCLCRKAGFTLIEALVAISILMIAIASPITMAQKSLVSSMFARDQMIATFLAQDGIEGIKNMRDQIAMNGVKAPFTPWLSGLDSCFCSSVSGTDNCNFDKDDGSFVGCNIDTTIAMGVSGQLSSFSGKANIIPIKAYYGDNSLFKGFSLVNGEPTKFKRVINIEINPNHLSSSDLMSNNEAKVQVRVFWDSPMGEKKVDIVFFMYNYEPKFK